MKLIGKKIKNIILKSFFVVSFLIIYSAPLLSFSADYKLLEPITEGITSVSTINNDIENYVQLGYRYILGLTVALSILMIIVGGLEYSSSFVSESQTSAAKKRIENAITGLLIALLGYAGLYMINPNLTKMKLPGVNETCKVEITNNKIGVNPGPYYGNAKGTGLSDKYKSPSAGTEQELRKELVDGGIIETKVPCPPGQIINCVNLNGLGQTAVAGIKKLKKDVFGDSKLFVSGGTEGGHGTHCEGCNQVDIHFNDKVNSWVLNNGGTPKYTTLGPEYTMPNGDKYLQENDHWHIYFANA